MLRAQRSNVIDEDYGEEEEDEIEQESTTLPKEDFEDDEEEEKEEGGDSSGVGLSKLHESEMNLHGESTSSVPSSTNVTYDHKENQTLQEALGANNSALGASEVCS